MLPVSRRGGRHRTPGGFATWPVPPIIVTGADAEKHDAYAAANVALTKSGTSTLELALAGVPMAVTYRVNPLSAPPWHGA